MCVYMYIPVSPRLCVQLVHAAPDLAVAPEDALGVLFLPVPMPSCAKVDQWGD